MISKTYTAFLLLENGMSCQGWSFFNFSPSVGEVVFNTGMTGYQEIITDPSYYDQMILFTYPEIGNTGINSSDIESDRPYIKGLIAKSICLTPSSWRSQISLATYLFEHNIPHIFGIDTRCLVKFLRNSGVMVGCIATSKTALSSFSLKVDRFKTSQNVSIVNKVTTHKSYNWLPKLIPSNSNLARTNLVSQTNSLHVIVIDYGVKFNILNKLIFFGCTVTVVPADTSWHFIISKSPDGILLSNGPGDPSVLVDAVNNIKKLIDFNIPIFGICLGHQLLSLALNAKTYKLKFGHRGLNHPSGAYSIVAMTSQNHGYVVSVDTISQRLADTVFMNLNDNTVSCIVHRYKPCFSVQYHPEASPGPHDSDYLFFHFIQVMSFCKSALSNSLVAAL